MADNDNNRRAASSPSTSTSTSTSTPAYPSPSHAPYLWELVRERNSGGSGGTPEPLQAIVLPASFFRRHPYVVLLGKEGESKRFATISSAAKTAAHYKVGFYDHTSGGKVGSYRTAEEAQKIADAALPMVEVGREREERETPWPRQDGARRSG